MTLYTKSGDDGTTGLFGAGRVAKDDPRVAAYGAVDEFNCALGLAVAACDGSTDVLSRMKTALGAMQNTLFDLGADLATPPGSAHEHQIRRIGDDAVRELERLIDDIDSGNTPMKQFILPGGTELASRLHMARTICRRAERAVVSLARDQSINAVSQVYLNRASDLLFAMARRANVEAGVQDIAWQKHV